MLPHTIRRVDAKNGAVLVEIRSDLLHTLVQNARIGGAIRSILAHSPLASSPGWTRMQDAVRNLFTISSGVRADCDGNDKRLYAVSAILESNLDEFSRSPIPEPDVARFISLLGNLDSAGRFIGGQNVSIDKIGDFADTVIDRLGQTHEFEFEEEEELSVAPVSPELATV